MSVTEDSVNDFKTIKTYPTVDDIKRENEPKLAKNRIQESYQNTDNYLKTQFHLLREEFVRSLIDDINKLKQLYKQFNKDIEKAKNDFQDVVQTIKTDNTVATDLTDSTEENTTNRIKEQMKEFQNKVEKEMDSNVFFDIKLIKPFVDSDINYGTLLKFTFDYKSLEKIDLIDCQPLMSGGILCLSSDYFEKSIVFGIIVNTLFGQIDPKTKEKVWSFSLKLDLDNNKAEEFCKFLLSPNTTYIGVESPSYYEGFRYTLENLQNMPQNFPFKRYIVDNKTGIKAPEYLTKELIYDMSCIESKNTENLDQNIELVENSKGKPLSSVTLQSNDVFGKDKSLYNRGIDLLKKCSTFDTKQFDAFYAALTKELCLVEGPPGTGKTFVGLKIVECLLKNRQMWDQSTDIRPILIVCFKNHALDQFLEGIIKFNRNVVRIGGKSESDKLQDFKLGTIENNFREELKNFQKFPETQKLNSNTENEIKDSHIEEDGDQTLKKEDKENENNKRKLDPELIRSYRKYQKFNKGIHAIYKTAEELVDKVTESFEKILEFKDIKPFIKPKSLAQKIEGIGLKDWLNSENDPNFENICIKKLKQKRFSEYIFDETLTISKKNISDMEMNEKWLLYLYWRERMFDKTQHLLNQNFQTSFEERKKFMNKRVVFRRMLCKGTEVIGLTITGASKYKDLVKAFNPKIMIVEEAAEVLEGHVVSAFPSKLEHLILIGDHKQLRPLTNVQELTKNYFLDISLFERLVTNKQQFVQLELQHRMRPTISELLKVGNIYDNLRDGQKVLEYEDMKYTFNKNVYFIDHQNIEDSNFCRDVPDKSRSNLHEAKYVLQLVKYFLLRNYSEEKITVLAAYNAQTSLIKKLMFDQKGVFVKEVTNKKLTQTTESNKPEEELTVRVSSIDGFQGEENDIIIISFVRSSKTNSIGFLEVKNRVNVALSRARHALFCIGNFTIMAKEAKTDMWAPIKEHLSQNKCFGEEFTIGCECTGEFDISMPGQLALLNLQLENGRCNGRCSGPNSR